MMKKFIIERNVPGMGKSSPQEMKAACQKSNDTLQQMNNSVQWQHSYVTNDKLYCIYLAENKEAIQEHAAISGFPADRIELVQTVIDPVSAE